MTTEAAEISAIGDSANSTGHSVRYTPENTLLINRWFARLPISRGWSIALIGGFFLLVPAMLAYGSGYTDIALLHANYRAQFIYALFLVYVLLIVPVIERASERVVRALRPVTQLNDDAFQSMVDRASYVAASKELLAVGLGMAVGLIINVLFEPLPESPSSLNIYAYGSRVAIFGVIGWTVFTLPRGIRLTHAVLEQPIAVDPFDLEPFEPIGRQGLLLALTVLGGAILSLLSASVYNRSLWAEYIFVYGVGVIGIFILFFWSMQSVHQVLAASKRGHLDSVEHNIAGAYAKLQRNIADNEETLAVATELNALVAAKSQLRETRTWPFNTEMLSTLSVAVLTPLFVGLARFLAMFLGG